MSVLLGVGSLQVMSTLIAGQDMVHSFRETRAESLRRRCDVGVLTVEVAVVFGSALVLRKNQAPLSTVSLIMAIVTVGAIWEMYFCHSKSISTNKQSVLMGLSFLGHLYSGCLLEYVIFNMSIHEGYGTIILGLAGTIAFTLLFPIHSAVIKQNTKQTNSGSALRENIEKKGEQINYFANANTPTMKNIKHNPEQTKSGSALRENIEKKGENSYYFAHANTPTMENVNRGSDPVMLSRNRKQSAENPMEPLKCVQIRKYAFSPGKNIVSIYIDLVSLIGEAGEVAHEIESDEFSFKLTIRNTHVLHVPKLKHSIQPRAVVKFNSSKDRMTVVLKKAIPTDEWSTLV